MGDERNKNPFFIPALIAVVVFYVSSYLLLKYCSLYVYRIICQRPRQHLLITR